MKKLIFIALSLLLLASLLLPVSAYSVKIKDNAGLLDTDAETRIASNAANAHGLSFYLVTQRSFQREDILSNSEMEYLCGFTEDEAAVVLLVTLVNSAYFYDVYTYNGADDMFSNSDVNAVLDAKAVYDNLKEGKIEEGATAFFRECCKVAHRYADEQAAKERRAPLVATIIGVVVGLLAGGGAMLGVFLYYRKKQHGESYPLDRYAKLNLTEAEDRFVGSFVTRTRVQSSSGGSSGGGGSRGGHRGGR